MLDVIERQHGIEQHEPGLVLAVGLPARPRCSHAARAPARTRRGVVADEADGAAREARQARHERRAEFGHEPAQRRHERLVDLGGHAGSVDGRPALARPQDEEGILAEERVARDLLAALDALEQERVVGVLGDLEKRRDRRQQVRDDFLDDRHERAPARQLHELFERCLLHNSCAASAWHVAPAAVGEKTRRAAAARSRARTDARPARRASRARRSSRQPAARAALSSSVVFGLVDQVVDHPAVERGAGDRVRGAAGAAGRNGVDEQVPRSGGGGKARDAPPTSSRDLPRAASVAARRS